MCTVFIAVGVISIFSGLQGSRLDSLKFTLPEGFTVTAHTGCLSTKENTLESMRLGIQYAPVIEFDIRFLEDGTPVLSHDVPKVECIPLSQALNFVYENGVKANIDLKETTNLARVQEIINFYNLRDNVFFTGVEEGDVEAVKKDSPDIYYFLNVSVDSSKKNNDGYIKALVEKVKDSGAVGINLHYKGASKKLVDAFHESGLYVSLWTVNGRRDIIRMLALSPDNITSKRPDRVDEIIRKHS